MHHRENNLHFFSHHYSKESSILTWQVWTWIIADILVWAADSWKTESETNLIENFNFKVNENKEINSSPEMSEIGSSASVRKCNLFHIRLMLNLVLHQRSHHRYFRFSRKEVWNTHLWNCCSLVGKRNNKNVLRKNSFLG